jgi:hypothetical protein
MGAEFSQKPTQAELKSAALDPDQANLGSDRPISTFDQLASMPDEGLDSLCNTGISAESKFNCESTATAKILENLDKQMDAFHIAVEGEETKLTGLYEKAQEKFKPIEEYHKAHNTNPEIIAHIKEDIFKEFKEVAERHYHMKASEVSFAETAKLAKDNYEAGLSYGKKGEYGIAHTEFENSRDLANGITSRIKEYLDVVGKPQNNAGQAPLTQREMFESFDGWRDD